MPESWKSKAETSKYYKNAVDVYTKKDPEKRSYASRNDLNYLEIWNGDLDKGLDWVASLLPKHG